MTGRRGKSSEHPALAQIRAYWEALRNGDDLPTRAEIDPRGIERALEYAFIAERIAPGIARLRIAGTHLADILGMEVRGMPLTAFIEPGSRDEIARITESAFATPAAVTVALEGDRGIGRPSITARLLLLPLRNEAGEVTRVLGALAVEGQIGRAPRRFRVTGVETAPIAARTRPGLAAIGVEPETRPAPVLEPGLAEPPAQFDHEPSGAPKANGKRPNLRLVHSRD
jgi:hypothetical protein